MNKKEFFKQRIDKIAKESFNNDQKEIAKKIIDQSNDNDLDAVWGLISQRVKTGFVFDEAPEINHDCVAYIKENEKLGINVGKENTVEHSLIIGENYDALKNLVALYTDKQGNGLVDVIYIDPPYNTDKSKKEGNDYKEEVEGKNKFIYRDKYTRDGWLNMMNERLKLSKKLLSDDGVIFISIDDKEQAYLKILCDEIFGEENFVENFIWVKNPNPTFLNKFSRATCEYIVCYSKDKSKLEYLDGGVVSSNETDAPLQNKGNPNRIINVRKGIAVCDFDDQVIKAGKYGLVNLLDDVEIKKHTNINDFRISGTFRMTEKTMYERIQEGCILRFKTNKMSPRLSYKAGEKHFAPQKLIVFEPQQLIGSDIGGTNQIANNELTKILSTLDFDYPKPVLLIKYLIKLAHKPKDSVVLDFFAGSGTTGHAVMELNEEDGGNRKFILVTNNENNIAKDITRERLYRVINGKGSNGEKFEWKYSNDKKNLPNNSLRVFDIVKQNLSITDIDKAEKIKMEAEGNFVKLNPNYKSKSDMDIYNVLASLTPYKNESED